MKALSIVSPKGGVGKTTVALNVAFALARRGQRVLLVDTDPQGGIGLSLMNLKAGPGLTGFLTRRAPLASVLVKTRLAELHLLPVGNLALHDTHAFEARLADGAELKRLLTEASGGYDLVLFDTPSGFNGATLGALRASRYALCPLQSEPLAMRAASQLLEVVGALRDKGAEIELAGFVLTMLDLRNPDSLKVATEAWSDFPPQAVLQTTIPRDAIFHKASGAGVPVGLLSSRPPPIAGLFEQVALELEQRMLLGKEGAHDGPISLLA